MKTIICVECGVKPCKRGAIKYCSKECSLKNTAVQSQNFDRESLYKRRKVWNRGKKGIHLSPTSEFQEGHQINLGRIREDVGEKSGCWVEPITTKCAQCLKPLKLKPNQIKRRKRNFCDRTCWALGTRGNSSPVYKGEKAVSRLRGRIACMPEYRTWHAAVMKRDKYKCVKCKTVHTRNTPLEVDHIKRFLFIANEYKILTPEDARNCAELWDTKNGQTVCRPCHRALLTYGTKGLGKNLSA